VFYWRLSITKIISPRRGVSQTTEKNIKAQNNKGFRIEKKLLPTGTKNV
jgi:hypothetical protein